MRCPYCSSSSGRCTTTATGKSITTCINCYRVTEERHSHSHHLFHLRSTSSPLLLSTNDLPTSLSTITPSLTHPSSDDDPFLPTGFITAFSTFSLQPHPVFATSSLSSSGHLAELERLFDAISELFITASSTFSLHPHPVFASSSLFSSGHLSDLERLFDATSELFITASSTFSLHPHHIFASSSLFSSGHLSDLERLFDATSASSSGASVVVDNLRAYLQIIDVASILRLEYDISDHAFELFRDCSSATCLRNRSVEALATAALVQAIREAQEPRTLQEISLAANLPQKEIGKYIKILGEALQLSQPLNSNSIGVHMPRFCTLLQLNKSAQELATHIGEVVINKCFCTRRNPISISAAAIYLACQLEDKRKTQAEICKITGLTEVTLRKVYKELLENWDDLLPSNYTPAVPPEKAFPTTTIASGRSSSMREKDILEEREKHPEVKPLKSNDYVKASGERKGGIDEMDIDTQANSDKQGLESVDSEPKGVKTYTMGWQFLHSASEVVNSSFSFGNQPKVTGTSFGDLNGARNHSGENKRLD